MSDGSMHKVIVCGRFNVGKSAIVSRLINDRFSESYNVTVGVEYMQTEVLVDDHAVTLQVWDSAGQEKFKSMVKMFFTGVVAVFLTYAIDD